MKVIIVGGVAGGASAAARLRRLNEKAQITIFERSGFVSYANCGLPYYLGGVIEDQADLTIQTPDSLKQRFNIDVKTEHEVTKIDRDNKTVTVHDLRNDIVFTENYDKLLLAPGAAPVIPSIPGLPSIVEANLSHAIPQAKDNYTKLNSSNIYTLRTVEDTLRLKETISKTIIKSAAIVGGGFIGVEVAENLLKIGLKVTLIERGDHIIAPLDRDMATFLHSHLRNHGLNLILNTNVTGFKSIGSSVKVELENKESIEADLVLLAIGVAPEFTLAQEAGLKLGPRHSIAVNEHMQTSDPNIYAVGDAVSITNCITEQKAVIALAGPANKQGRIAADNIAGLESVYRGSVGTAILQVFQMTAAFTGLNEQAAQNAGIKYKKVIISPASHASYYPGASVMTMKLLFAAETNKIIGAQIVGFDGVDKRLDVIATAMQAGLTAPQLKELDLAYAPPYSSAKDPVNMLGFVTENVISGKVKLFFYEDLASLPHNGSVILLDTRTDREYKAGFAPGFTTHIPIDELRERLSELDKSKTIYVMCQSGLRSYIACRILSQEGFQCLSFAGGYRFYKNVNQESFEEKCQTNCGI